MNSKVFIGMAMNLVSNFYRKREIDEDVSVYVVWSCKTLQNNKALLSTPVSDGRYFEVTYDGERDKFYLDCYVKESNIAISPDDVYFM